MRTFIRRRSTFIAVLPVVAFPADVASRVAAGVSSGASSGERAVVARSGDSTSAMVGRPARWRASISSDRSVSSIGEPTSKMSASRNSVGTQLSSGDIREVWPAATR